MPTTPLHLLRDTCLAAVALTILGLAAGEGLAVAMGALAACANLAVLTVSIGGLSRVNLLARLLVLHVGAFAALALLLSVFSAAPVLVGFLAPVVAAAITGVRGLFRSSVSPTAEHG